MARHSLQRLASPSRTASAVIHLLGIASFSASFRYLFVFPNPQSEQFGGSFQFLTIIGLALACASMVFGFLADITLNQTFFDIKNVISVCSAPLEVLISTLYWGISLIDKALLFPPELQLPPLPDIGFHLMPAVMLTIDLLLFSPPWTIKAYGAMGISTAIAFLYWGWVEYCFSRNQVYPYPLFSVLSTWQRVLLFGTSATLMTGSTMVLKWVYGKLNGIEEFKKEATKPVKLE